MSYHNRPNQRIAASSIGVAIHPIRIAIDHRCLAADCQIPIAHDLIMCVNHWANLPPYLQRTLSHQWALESADPAAIETNQILKSALNEARAALAWLDARKESERVQHAAILRITQGRRKGSAIRHA